MGMAMMGSASSSGESRARMAAEMAVSSPFLEDINLAGACGILINITAGLEMTIGEFEEVGNVVREFASEDATVVIGTSLDPDSNGEMRVTVVATGLNRERVASNDDVNQPVEVISTGTNGAIDYGELDRPTAVRHMEATTEITPALGDAELATLEIPAFLRRQAD